MDYAAYRQEHRSKTPRMPKQTCGNGHYIDTPNQNCIACDGRPLTPLEMRCLMANGEWIILEKDESELISALEEKVLEQECANGHEYAAGLNECDKCENVTEKKTTFPFSESTRYTAVVVIPQHRMLSSTTRQRTIAMPNLDLVKCANGHVCLKAKKQCGICRIKFQGNNYSPYDATLEKGEELEKYFGVTFYNCKYQKQILRAKQVAAEDSAALICNSGGKLLKRRQPGRGKSGQPGNGKTPSQRRSTSGNQGKGGSKGGRKVKKQVTASQQAIEPENPLIIPKPANPSVIPEPENPPAIPEPENPPATPEPQKPPSISEPEPEIPEEIAPKKIWKGRGRRIERK